MVLEPEPDSIAHRLPLPAGHQVEMEDDLVATVEIATLQATSLLLSLGSKYFLSFLKYYGNISVIYGIETLEIFHATSLFSTPSQSEPHR